MPTDIELPEGLVRVRVALERAEGDPGPDADFVWAESLGSGRFRVESCPFFAYGVSRDDVIGVGGAREPDGPVLEHVVRKGGHRTLRVALAPEARLSDEDVHHLLARTIELGCTHETLPPKIIAVDVPPEADLGAVLAHLEALARGGRLVWEWADPRPC